MRKNDIRIFFRTGLHGIEIAVADAENDVASVTCELIDRSFNLLIVFLYIIHNVKIGCRIEPTCVIASVIPLLCA